MKVITLLTDFGLEDGYVAAMKGVMLGICPQLTLVDISHLIRPQDIRSGAFVLSTTYPYFPAGTIHVAVVDPGVGTDRRALAVYAGGHYFVGPDNGIFSLILQRHPDARVRLISDRQWWLPEVSATFHGRDIFAPVAAHLARGTALSAIGPPCRAYSPPWATPKQEHLQIEGEIVHIDHFGNAISNIAKEHLKALGALRELKVILPNGGCVPFRSTYADAGAGHGLALIGSSGHVEIAVNRGSAAAAFDLEPGIEIRVVSDDCR